uniref:Uncharacterized protein n=1 Tax=Clastoptera arizonana TaxID=38151 RepID=A0A1B6E253_9HEMI
MDNEVKGSNEIINNDFKIIFPYNQTDGLDSKDTNYQDSVIINNVNVVTSIGQGDSELKLVTKDDEQKCVFDQFIWNSNESVFSSVHNDMKNLISPSKRIMAIDECYNPIKKPKTEININNLKSSENAALSLTYLHSKPVPDFPRLFDIPSNTSAEEVLPAVIEVLSTNKIKAEKKQQNSLTIQESLDSNDEVHPTTIDNFNSNCIEIQQNYHNNTTKEESSGKVNPDQLQSNLKEAVISPPAMNPATLIAYTPGGQRFEVDLTVDRPTYFKNEYARFQYDEATLINAQKMMYEIEVGNIVPKDLDPNIERQHNTEKIFVKKVLEDTLGKMNSESSDEEDTFQRRESKFDNSDDDDDDTSNNVKDLQLLKVELSLLKFHQDISLMICDNPDECLVKFDEILQLQFKPIIFKKNPQLLELAKRLMNQSDFPDIQTAGRMFYNKIKVI